MLEIFYDQNIQHPAKEVWQMDDVYANYFCKKKN